MTWLVVTTTKGKEVRMYRAMLEADIATDAWLPTALYLIRPTVRHAGGEMREKWQCVLPRTFFACIPPERRYMLSYLKEPTFAMRDAGGCPIIVPADQIAHYRDALAMENIERSILASRIRSREAGRANKASWLPDSLKRKRPSRRLKNAGKVASEIKAWGEGMAAAQDQTQAA